MKYCFPLKNHKHFYIVEFKIFHVMLIEVFYGCFCVPDNGLIYLTWCKNENENLLVLFQIGT